MALIECSRPRIVPGFVLGLEQTSCLAELSIAAAIECSACSARLAEVSANALPPERPGIRPDTAGADEFELLATEIAVAAARLQEASGIPVFGAVQVSSLERLVRVRAEQASMDRTARVRVVIPSHSPNAALGALHAVLRVVERLAEGGDPALTAACASMLETVVDDLARLAPQGSNNIRLIRAAHEAGIPVVSLPGGVLQFGWGVSSRWFASTFTDETSAIASIQCKDKILTNATLRAAGFPVPTGGRVSNEAAAIELANRLGYPVVVKPADLDQGRGVSADLHGPESVGAAFRRAAESSNRILLERHIAGTAYRVTLFRGRVISITKRLPAGVLGDGRSSIEDLVAMVNQDPRRSTSRFSIMRPLVVDEEAMQLLAEAGLDRSSIVECGRFVAFRRAANVSTGGDTVVIDEREIHPSYFSLCTRVTRMLRLDVAAIDLVTTDIGRPYPEADAAIIEVNAQPQMGTFLTHLHGVLLRQYVHGDGTVPSAVAFGPGADEFVARLRERLAPEGSRGRLGTIDRTGVYVGGERIAIAQHVDADAMTPLLVDPTVDGLLVALDLRDFQRSGMPLPRVDHLVLPGVQPDGAELLARMSTAAAHVRKSILVLRDQPGSEQLERSHPLLVRRLEAAAVDDIVAASLSSPPPPHHWWSE